MGEWQGLCTYILLSPLQAPYSRKTGYILRAKGKAHMVTGQDTHIRNGS